MGTYTETSVNPGVNAPPLRLVLEDGRDEVEGRKLGAEGCANALADLKLDGMARDGVSLEADAPTVGSRFRVGVWSGLAPP
jgi:hypothetical protein